LYDWSLLLVYTAYLRTMMEMYGHKLGRLSHRHILSSKSLQPLLALVSYEADEEP
jgi:hypothetical protein